MTLEEAEKIIGIIAAILSVPGVWFFCWQVYRIRKQQERDSLKNTLEGAEALLLPGFSNPRLFQHISNVQSKDLVNVPDEEWVARRLDIADFLSVNAVLQHWAKHRKYYSKSFQSFIDSCIE